MKQNKHVYVAISVIVLSLLGITSFVGALPPMQGGQQPQQFGNMGRPQQGMPPGQPGQRMSPEQGRSGGNQQMPWQEIGLSEEQQAQIQQLRRELQMNTASMQQELQFAEQDLRAEMLKNSVDRAKIDGLLNSISQLKQQLSEARTQNLLAMKNIFTAEQLETLSSLRQPLPKELRGVELTSEQRAQIGALMQASREENQAIQEELRELRPELQELLQTTGQTDVMKLQQIQVSIAAKELALEKERVEIFLQIKALLTSEQLEQLSQGPMKRQNRPVMKGQK